jgi:hypothetical protein
VRRFAHENPWQPRAGSNVYTFIPVHLSGLKPRMHCFEAVWWISCSRLREALGHPQSEILPK